MQMAQLQWCHLVAKFLAYVCKWRLVTKFRINAWCHLVAKSGTYVQILVVKFATVVPLALFNEHCLLSF